MAPNRSIPFCWNHELTSIDVDDSLIVSFFQGPEDLSPDSVTGEVQRLFREASGDSPVALQSLLVGDDQVAVPVSGEPVIIQQVLKPLITHLLENGVRPENISVICTPEEAPFYHSEEFSGVSFVTHDPNADDQKAYLASTLSGSRIYLNRLLLDADVVFPIFVAEPVGQGPALGYLSAYWPGFSDLESGKSLKSRFRENCRTARKEVQEVLWLSGLHLVIVAIPSKTGIRCLHSYSPAELQRKVIRQVREDWQISQSHLADHALLISQLQHSPNITANLSKILKLAGKLSFSCQRIALVLDLPDEFCSQIAQLNEEQWLQIGWIRQLAEIGRRCKFYLLSNLPEDLVEYCDLIGLEDPSELHRLVSRNGSWIVISDAQRARSEN